MSVFTYQKWKKRESEQKIINALSDGNKSFGDLLDLTNLSKPVLSKRLKSLIKQNKIEVVPETEAKRFLYRLIYESLDATEKALVILHELSKYVVTFLEKSAKDPTISDKEYVNMLIEGISMLWKFRMFAYTLAPKSVREEWLKTTVGLEFVREIPKLFPENRNLLPHMLYEIPLEEQTIFKSKDLKQTADRLLEYLNKALNKLSTKK